MDVTLDEAREIAREAYIFFQPVVDEYRLKLQYGLPANKFIVVPFPLGASVKITPYNCADQAYAIAFLDLRQEPVVYSVPASPTRYNSVMAVDHFAHNFAYIGTRTTGGDKAVDLMISGPGWNGTAPTPAANTILSSATSETNFVTLIHRLEVYGKDDYENGVQILRSCDLQTLSAYNGNTAPDRLKKPDFPPYKSDQLQRAGFFEYVNAYIAFAESYPGEASYYARFARIGVSPGGPYPPPAMSSTLIEAIEQGIWAGNSAIESELVRPKGVSKNGWSYNFCPPQNGSREDMAGRYLARAASARSDFEWGNSPQEATYMQTFHDEAGEALDGSSQYTLVWSQDQLPKVKAFWSITLYDTDGWYVANSIDRFSLASNKDTEPLQYDAADGSLTIYIQSTALAAGLPSNNWLPCPSSGHFQLFMRLYLPGDELLYGNDVQDQIPPGPIKT